MVNIAVSTTYIFTFLKFVLSLASESKTNIITRKKIMHLKIEMKKEKPHRVFWDRFRIFDALHELEKKKLLHAHIYKKKYNVREMIKKKKACENMKKKYTKNKKSVIFIQTI